MGFSTVGLSQPNIQQLAKEAANVTVSVDIDRLEAVLIELARTIADKKSDVTVNPTIDVNVPEIKINVPEQKLPDIKIENPVSVAPAAVTVVLTPWVILMAGIIPAVATLADIIIRIWFM
jgi:hypothetical protein